MRPHIVLALVALGAAVTPLPAVADSPQPESRSFAVSVQGVQTDAYTYSHHKSFACDVDGHGAGTEVVRFASVRPEVTTAKRYGNVVVFGNGKLGDSDLRLSARITRHRQEWHGTLDPACQGTGGGGTATAPDCGSKRTHFDLTPELTAPGRRQGIALNTGFIPAMPVFRNCPINGVGFPEILSVDKTRQIVARISASHLFSPSSRPRVVTAAGKLVERYPTSWQETTIKWTIRLTPVR